ncbi:MAG: CCA tRNA nucleotidyltransferase [Alphaproteobacteria bacterium]|nr:CCA tRNA nucleotidyltransferase [Alphaproteobacteria bacterium]
MQKSDYLDTSNLLRTAHIVKLFNAVEDYGGIIRFVGGAVRDTLAGLKDFGLDLATNLSPDELVEACQNYGLKTTPIGLKIGVVGVVIDNQILEVSSLRKRVQTSKKKVQYEYTDDWSADAAGRDLTINAVYADIDGNVFDYYNGITDLEKGIVRFIGNPEDRIQEDYLRIMRFFRFYARFGKTPPDEDSLAACIKYKDKLRTVSIECVRDEFFKLLEAPNAAKTLKIILDNDILDFFLPHSEHLEALQRLSDIVKDINYQSNFLRRLFVLYQPNAAFAEKIAATLRLTKKQKELFVRWARIELPENIVISENERLKAIYRYGKQFCLDKLLLAVAIYDIDAPNLKDILQSIEDAVVPVFPLRGRDLVNQGYKDNRKIGQILSIAEQKWMDSNFKLTRGELLENLASLKEGEKL